MSRRARSPILRSGRIRSGHCNSSAGERASIKHLMLLSRHWAPWRRESRSQSAGRSSAARGYAAFAGRTPDDLPSLVHEGFLLLLADPFVVVHSSALEALGEVSLPGQSTARARDLALA